MGKVAPPSVDAEMVNPLKESSLSIPENWMVKDLPEVRVSPPAGEMTITSGGVASLVPNSPSSELPPLLVMAIEPVESPPETGWKETLKVVLSPDEREVEAG